MKNVFESVYPFTTEYIGRYCKALELEGKDVLTVGSSGDHAFNALFCGAGKVTIMDISPYTNEFIKLKKDIIINNSRKKAYKKVLEIENIPFNSDIFSYNDIADMNLYFKDKNSYKLMQELLERKDIEVITGDIFKMDEVIPDRKFDRMLFSNVVQYFDYFAKVAGYEGREKEFLRNSLDMWIKHLNDDGLMQLMYYYSVIGQRDEIVKLKHCLHDYPLFGYGFNGINRKNDSAILTYRKK